MLTIGKHYLISGILQVFPAYLLSGKGEKNDLFSYYDTLS